MINSQMRLYDFYLYDHFNKYNQAVLSEEPQGQIKMAINSISQSVSQDIRYKDATYIGLTYSDVIDDTFVISGVEGAGRCKVLYVEPRGRLKQVWMKNL